MAIKIGVIGCGTVAGYGHIPGLLEVPELELAAISDLNTERLIELQNKHNIPDTYTNYLDLLARDDIEAVTIATPVQYHHPVVMAAAKAGKHVFCEKPIAESPEKGMEMVQAMENAGRILAINFENRVSDPFPEMKKLLDAGEIGNLRVMRFVNNWMGGRWASEERYRSLIIEGKGPIVDCGVHYFDMARWFSKSEFADITAIGVHIEDYPNPDHVIATCKMDNGVISLIEGGWAYTHNTPQHHVLYQIELIGDRGIMGFIFREVDDSEDSLLKEFYVYSQNGSTRRKLAPANKNFVRMYSLFAESVQSGKLIGLPSGTDGYKALQAALKALESAQNQS